MAKVNKVLGSPMEMEALPLHRVKITLPESISPDGVAIEGLLQEGLSITYSPEYTTVGEMIPFPAISALEKGAASAFGVQLFDGITTQKQYTGGSYIDITVNIKVLDYDGSGTPMAYSKLLAMLCQPTSLKPGVVKKIQKEIKKAATEIPAVAADIISGNFGKNEKLEELMKSNASKIVTLEISDYIKFEEMVVTSVTQTFSFEQSFTGPLFAEFAIGLSTLRVPTASKTANYYKTPKESRVSIGA
tara:strand:+ start:8953 stop:9690 length:738 start_codon:yes stop_codon:yes gene_type:complete